MIRLLLAIPCLIIVFISQAQYKTMPTQQITELRIVPDDSIIVEAPDKMPEYVGGQDALMKKLSENLIYPSECAEAEIQGKVVVKFVVNTNGKIGNIEVVKSVHPALDTEAIRVVALLDDWVPGKMNGETVSVYYTLPISFKLQGDSSPLPDFSKWSFFELRDGLIAFFQDLYKDIPSTEHEMTNATVINDYIGVKCIVHFSKLPDYVRNYLKEEDYDGVAIVMSEKLAPLLPYGFRMALAEHGVKLTYEIYDDSTGEKYIVTIDKDYWIPENWETIKVTEIQIVED